MAVHSRSGTIVNLSSITGRVAAPFWGIYAATKHAVEAISDALSYELMPYGVRVVVIEPGRFQSRFHENQIVARRAGASSAYAEMSQRFAGGFVNRAGAGAGPSGDPSEVATVIADAVMDETPSRRYLVGRDAEAIVSLHRQLSDEEFVETMRGMLQAGGGAAPG